MVKKPLVMVTGLHENTHEVTSLSVCFVQGNGKKALCTHIYQKYKLCPIV